MAYATVGDVLTVLDDPYANTAVIELALPAIGISIDRWCRTSFASVAQTRSVDWVSRYYVILPSDLCYLTSVVSARGTHATAHTKGVGPWRRVYVDAHVDVTGLTWTTTPRNAIQVTGIWGYAQSVPNNVKLATITWVLLVYQQLIQKGFSVVQAGGISSQVAELTKDPPESIQGLLRGYRRPRF